MTDLTPKQLTEAVSQLLTRLQEAEFRLNILESKQQCLGCKKLMDPDTYRKHDCPAGLPRG